MKSFIAFTKKEFAESIRTYSMLILLGVFLLFGMLNPITAKFLPEILSSVLPDGMSVTLANPSAIDSWTQFYKNMPMQIIMLIIIFCGTVANEISKGTLINMLTKGLSRTTVILSKFTSITILWTLSYLICFAVTYGYTLYLLPGELQNILFAALCMWLYGVLLIAVMLVGGVLLGNIYGSLFLTGGFSLFLMFLSILPQLEKYNPYKLASGNMPLLIGEVNVTDFVPALIISIALSVVFLWITVTVFSRKQI